MFPFGNSRFFCISGTSAITCTCFRRAANPFALSSGRAGICFPADGCTGEYCRTDTYVCIGFRRSREAAGNVPADLFQQPLPSSFYAKGRNSCRYAALRNRRSHENPPPSERRGDYMLKVLYDRMVRDVEILVLREYHRATVFETPADESCPRVFATTRDDKVFVTMQ